MVGKRGLINAKLFVFNIGFFLSLLAVSLTALTSYGIIPTKDSLSFGTLLLIYELLVSAGLGLMALSRDM